jgi:hypothetical protein
MHPLERYLSELRGVRQAGGVPETSGYPCLKSLLDDVGSAFKPKVVCVLHPANTGAGIVDAGLFEKNQLRGGEVRRGQLPLRGVVEIKSVAEPVSHTIGSEQIARYVAHFGQVLVTNYRQFALLVRTPEGSRKIDEFSLAESAEEFWALAEHPRRAAETLGTRLDEFLRRALHTSVTLTNPKDVAWFLASYAREALDHLGDRELPALSNVRNAFEEALGVSFTGEKGDHFFRSSLVQTLFYGVFSGWVLWCREQGGATHAAFDWRDSAWTLRVPMIRALFEQVATPSALGQLGLKPFLDRTGEVLNRVDHAAFFSTFRLGEAVQYFYEPFLEAFDPELRKELGVWYTPREIVQYQVARVDWILRTELGIRKGLADQSVYVLDPCCGTGAYLVEVIRRIERTMQQEGDALLASDLRQAARKRIFGFELLPASFVIAHLQLGLLMLELGAPFNEDGDRAGVFLTNALTGWNEDHDRAHLPFPELEQERDRAEDVKRSQPILVILGNPPYNGFAGVTESEEERELTEAYRRVRRAPPPQGQGLNDLYVRFFRMAERKIVEASGKGIVSFITNYSWLDGLSFTGMRERFSDVFDHIEIVSLNGDRYRTGKLTPDGRPDPSVFSTESNREGIQVGTAITFASIDDPEEQDSALVRFRDLWGTTKLAALARYASEGGFDLPAPEVANPEPANGFSFRPMRLGADYHSWPTIAELIPVAFPGVQSKRDALVTDIDHDKLSSRMQAYFNPAVTDERMAEICKAAIKTPNRAFDLPAIRRRLQHEGFRGEAIVNFAFRPFDTRWLYYEPAEGLLGRPVIEYAAQANGNVPALVTQQRPRGDWYPPQVISVLGCLDLMDRSASIFLRRLRVDALEGPAYTTDLTTPLRENISPAAKNYLDSIGIGEEQVFPHVLAVLHAPGYRAENLDGLNHDWPRVPMPLHAVDLEDSARLGEALLVLLDPFHTESGSVRARVARDFGTVGLLAEVNHTPLDAERGDLALTAGWGIRGKGGVTMPGRGKITERPDGALDIWLNDRAFWANVPREVWEYTLGGYQVVKKWLSYREKALLGRDLTVEEARYVSEMIRRIAAILALGPELDENYERVKGNAFAWRG